MGVNQSKLNYEPSLRSQRSSRIVGDGDSRPNTSKLYQQRTIVKEETEPTLSRCTTRHGVLDPTTHSHYNDTTLKQPSKSTTLSPSTITRHNNNQHVLDSGYSSGWQQSSVLFSHISSNITTATDLSHFCLDDKPTNTASIVAQVAAATTCSNTSSASSSIAPHGIEKAATPISTKSILNQLAHAPHETQVILDRAFAFAYEQSDQKEPVYAAYTAALQWSQQVDDEDMRRAAQVWVARYHVEYNQHPANGFNQLKELAHGGCWQAFFPLALCYLKGVTSDDSTIIQPVDTTMARQWFSTAAQLDPKTTTDKTVLPTVALAQLHLGILMTREHDDRKAFDWFLKSANNGNAQAQFIVAIHYAMGLEVDVNKIKAKSYLERSAKQGFVHSETALGILHLEDDEYDQGLMWLERAEQKGDPRALFRLGLLYKSGQHRHYQTSATAMATVKQDWEKTVHYFKAAAEHGHPGALFQLALGYQKGSLGLQRNLALADQLIQQSAKAGYTPAQRFLGFMYREGWVITDASTTMAGSRIHHKKSDKMAFQWFYRAAQRHDLYAYILVGQCYEQGRGVPVNRKTALEYYQRAAENENSPYQAKAQHAMADLLLRIGRLSEAYHWFTLAASRQDDIEQEEEEPCDEEPLGWYDHWPTRRAKLMVARYHLHGWGGVTIDRQRAFNILTELTAHTNEDGHAHYWLATCYLEGIPDVCKINHAAAFQHYSIAAETSVLDSEYQLACMYANGKGVDRDLSKALAWYKKAASHGHEDALVTLGYHYYTMATKISQDNDTDTKKGNLSKAMQYFEKAADMGNVNAMERLGDILLSLASTPTLTLKGKRDRDHQRSQAVHYYTKAASMDHATAQRELGKLYHAGIGVAQDYERAFALFSKAAAQDDPAATLLLGNCYEHGHGTTQDQEKALELYQRSAQLDHPFAFFAAAQLYNELNRIQEAYTQYKLTANDHRLQSSTMTKTAKWMMSRYILDYDDIFGETKEDAFHMLSHLAITDNDEDPFTPAFYWLAYCFQYGIGTSIDLVQAIEWYQKAAEEDDNVEALVQLGLIHSQGGPGVPVDQGHAIDLIQRAAERGHPAGQYQLGMAYWRGLHSMTADEEKATRLFQDAATQGHGQSHWALGQMAYEKDDKTMALHCWQNGTQQGDSSSMRCQARLLLEHMPQENDLFMEQQYMDAIELLARAAQAGDIESHFYLGRIYLAEAALLKANGMTPQEQQLLVDEEERLMVIQQQHDEKTELAKQYLEKAAMADHVEAMFLLAQIWHEQQQYVTAHKYYERAAEQNHPLARVMRARYLLGDGILGVEPDPQAAFKELMDCAKNQGCVEAYHSLGQCHEYGLGTKQDYQQALDWYLKSFQVTGDAEALYRIGTLYAQGLVSPSDTNRSNDMEAHHWFEMACRMGNHARAHYRLGLYYLDGIKDQDDTVLLDSNQDTALQHLQLAAQQNDCDAMVMLGTLLNDEEWLDHAAQLGSRDALRELGKLYYLGNGVTEEQDFEQAYMLFHQAASLGDGDAAMFVGMYHEHGIHHIVPDLNEALKWYQVAVDNDQQSSWMAKLAMARVLHQLPGMQMRAYTCFQAAYEHAPSDSERILPDIMMARYRLHQWHSTCTDEEQRDAMTTLVKYANQGDARVFYQVAQCYDNGNVVEKDMHKAFEWYTRLEEFHAQLDEDAQDMLEEELQQDIRKTLYRLAEFYRNGWVTQVDLVKAALLENRASFSIEEENHIQSLPSPTSLS